MKIYLDGTNLSIESAIKIVSGNINVALSAESLRKVKASRRHVDKWIADNEVIYGVTTGFGEFKDVKISKADVKKLQKNLIRSHSAGVGTPLSPRLARLMLLLRINSLAKGYSGVRPELLEYLVKIFNLGIIPYIPSQGSVGSSGDLAPLSHLAAFITGDGYGYENNRLQPSVKILKKFNLMPFELEAKEGLALINGTQMMTACAVDTVYRAEKLSKLADIAAALSVEALRGSDKPFSARIHMLRPHSGQIKTAENLRKLLKNSEIRKSHINCDRVQDAYSLRCIPQVHGAVKDTIQFVKGIIETEINSATDNPLIFPETGEHIEGGNFHGEPVALAMDFLKIAVSELGSISERRTARLVDGNLSGLPRFLTDKGGLNSGLMIAQYTAASLVSENKILCHPASVDSIPTSANQEDHNSMGSIAARNCCSVLENTEKIIAIEFLCACQGIDFLKPLKCGRGTNIAYTAIRSSIRHITHDIVISRYINSVHKLITSANFLPEIENSIGSLN